MSYLPASGAALSASSPPALKPVFYHGGPVMTSSANYAFYWAPAGTRAFPGGYQSGIDRYFTDLAHDSGGEQNVESVASQYGDASGGFAGYQSSFAGEIDDAQAYPSTHDCPDAAVCITRPQIIQELRRYIAANHLPANLSTEYFVILPPDVQTCWYDYDSSSQSCSAGTSYRDRFCAYHSATTSAQGELVYAVQPYDNDDPKSGCVDGNYPNGSSDGAVEAGLSHEHNESLTDPEGTGWWAKDGDEIADECSVDERGTLAFGTPLGTTSSGRKYNQVINGRDYWYQEELSNRNLGCMQRFTLSNPLPTARFTATKTNGTTYKLDASSSSAPAGTGAIVNYVWWFDDGTKPYQTPSPTTSHTFPASGGPYDVALTVFLSNGASGATGGTVGPITVGDAVNPKPNPATCGEGPTNDLFNLTSAAGTASYQVPSNGTLISFSTRAYSLVGASGTKVALVVYRSGGDGTFFKVAQSRRSLDLTRNEQPAPIPVSMPVQAGDYIGLDMTGDPSNDATTCDLQTNSSGDTDTVFHPPFPSADSPASANALPDLLVSVQATLDGLPPVQ